MGDADAHDFTRRLRCLAIYLGDRVPLLGPIIDVSWAIYEHLKFSYYVARNASRRPDRRMPFEARAIMFIDPDHITHINTSFDFIFDSGKIVGGDWDRQGSEIRESGLYEAFRLRYCDGVEWEDIEYYRRNVDNMRAGNITKYGSTVEAVELYFEQLDIIYQSIQEGGYMPQHELRASTRPILDSFFSRLPFLESRNIVRHEISVSIGRSGELLLGDGRHRLTMLKFLDVENIPIRVVVRHARWQQLRDDLARFLDGHYSDASSSVRRSAMAEYLDEQLDWDIEFGANHPDLEILLELR